MPINDSNNTAKLYSISLIPAINGRFFDDVNFFLENGADPNYTDQTGCTPLLIAITHDYFELIVTLLSKKADANKPHAIHSWITPLKLAIDMQKSSTVMLLIEHGATLIESLADKENEQQSSLIKQIETVIQKNNPGVCHGVSHMAMQAILCRDLATFDDRLRLLERFVDPELLLKEIQNSRLNQQPSDFKVEIPIFFQGIDLYQNSWNYPHLLGKTKSTQDALKVIPLLLPQKLEEERGITQLCSYSGVYSVDQLALVLESFAAILTQADLRPKWPVSFIINTITHAIALGFDPASASWYFIDQQPSQLFTLSQTIELAQNIGNSFSRPFECGFLKTEVHELEDLKKYGQPQYILTKESFFYYSHLENKLSEIDCTREKIQQLHIIFSTIPRIDKLSQYLLLLINLFTGHVIEEQETAVLHSSIYGVKSDEEVLRQGVKAWCDSPCFKEIHNVSREKAQLLNSYHHSWLHIAAKTGSLDLVKILLSESAQVNQTDINGETPLILAAQEGCLDVVAELLNMKADIHQTNKLGFTPLHRAVVAGQSEIVSLLAAKNSNINQFSLNGRTPLYLAVQYNHSAIAQLLLNLGAEIDSVNQEGSTSLHIAIKRGELEVVDFFLKHRADIMRVDAMGKSALDLAIENNQAELISLLRVAAKREESKTDSNIPKYSNNAGIPIFDSPLNSTNLFFNTQSKSAKKDGALPHISLN